MIFLPHVGIINIPEAIILIKGDKEVAVSYRNITRHGVVSSQQIRERMIGRS